MISWHSYPSVFALGHAAINELFLDPVTATEKIDGSQISFGMFGGELKVRSKGKELILDAPEKMFKTAVENIQNMKDKLVDGWTYRGEYLQKEKHNVIQYSRVPINNIIIFDINTGDEKYLSYQAVKLECERIGLECVPLFFEGMITDFEFVNSLLEKESILGGSKIEGIVFKNYNKFGRDKKVLMGKYVSEKFKEIHKKEWSKNDSKTIIQILIEELKTDARYEKSVQHLKERGELGSSPKDIGKLIKEVQSDIEKECIDYIKDRLYKNFKDHILRAVSNGIPQWYKDKLAGKQFK